MADSFPVSGCGSLKRSHRDPVGEPPWWFLGGYVVVVRQVYGITSVRHGSGIVGLVTVLEWPKVALFGLALGKLMGGAGLG